MSEDKKITSDEIITRFQNLIKIVKAADVVVGSPCMYNGIPLVKLHIQNSENYDPVKDGKFAFIAIMSDHNIKPNLSALISNIAWIAGDEEIEVPPVVVGKKGESSEQSIRRVLDLPEDFDLSSLPKLGKSKAMATADNLIGENVKKEIQAKLDDILVKMADGSLSRQLKRAISWSFQACGSNPKEIISAASSFLRLAYAYNLDPSKAITNHVPIANTGLYKLGALIVLGSIVNKEVVLAFLPKVFEGVWAELPLPTRKNQDGEEEPVEIKSADYPKKNGDLFMFNAGTSIVTYRPITMPKED